MTSYSFTAAATAALIATLPLHAQAADVTLRLAHWIPAGISPAAKGVQPWAESIEKASDGRIDIQIFPAQQLGAAPDHFDMARDGIADITWVNPGYTAGRFPILSLVEVPFQVDDSVKGAKAIHEWYSAYVEQEMGEVKLCVMHPHAPGAIHSKTPIHVPADVAGKNVRPAHATMARFVTQLGGAPVQVPAPEAREAIARGTADAVTFPWGSMYDFKLADLTPYHLDMPLYISLQAIVMNKGAYAKLSPENKKVIDDHCTPEWSSKIVSGWAADDAAAYAKLTANPKYTFYKPTEAEVALWRAEGEKVLDTWRADMKAKGLDADAIYAAYVAALKANDADF